MHMVSAHCVARAQAGCSSSEGRRKRDGVSAGLKMMFPRPVTGALTEKVQAVYSIPN